MQRPEIRLIQDQQVETNENPNIDNWEAEQLLRKYGYQNTQYSTHQEKPASVNNELTFEQMIAQEEARIKGEKMRRQQQPNMNIYQLFSNHKNHIIH